MFVATSEWSGINLEAWFPRNWTGRSLSTGNGDFSWSTIAIIYTNGIQYEDLAYTAALGFATVGASNEHNGTSGALFLNNLDIVEDFAFRVVVGKNLNLTETFYRSPYTKSYYLGCTTGGRQDFDGVVGAPAVDFDHLNDWGGHFFGITGNTTASTFLPTQQWIDIVYRDRLAQCDEFDSVKDGVIEDPNLCDYDPSTLVCVEGSTNQTNTTCQFAYPRMQPGSEDVPFYYNGALSTYTSDWFRYVVHNNPNYDVTTLSDKQNAIISSKNSERYYDRVSQVMGLETWEIGQTLAGSGGNSNYLMNLDPESNVLMAMGRWVEEGIALERFSRAHCRYPLRNMYDEVGDPTKKDSWDCLEVD
ncbi:tannase-domain-containing protein [Dendrothele bispora CBS 962.96]|uniref:Carboxylic ester hydrolase n=1 Tax=Dendrothele bispora (strain CBS 962.96) TaxID=1314807 RepID=A0A4S8KZJ0_DENBC|nr:tannase-domain-containing protein [Dendrothele bispora CBS 962.96]